MNFFGDVRWVGSLLVAFLLAAFGGAAVAQSLEDSRLTVEGTGQVEVYVNGHYIGRSASATRLSVRARHLQVGDNVIALRADSGGSAAPFVFAELSGPFGRLGSSQLWRVSIAPAGLDWTQPGFDASAWPSATEMGNLPPSGGFPTGGPAQRVWTASSSDSHVALRAHVWLPPSSVTQPTGFGRATTGGMGGEVITVGTRDELASALCSTSSGGVCTDDTPRIIKVQGTIDFTGSEGTASGPGCFYSECTAPTLNERLVLLGPSDTHCDGKTVFDVTYDAAGASPLRVGSNKTLIGIGNDATLRGKGLFIGDGVENVIVRNLTIDRLNPGIIFAGDAITINDASRVWIDHNRFNRIGRQMIVTGYEPATEVTISWNDFDGRTEYGHRCDGRHYWNLLFLGDGDSISLTQNWIRHFSGRAPKVGGHGTNVGLIHIAGNYFEDGAWHALDVVEPTRALVEGNTFRSIDVPILNRDDGPGAVWAEIGAPTSGHQTLCQEWIHRNCVGNSLVDQPAGWDNHFRNDLVVLGDFSSLAPVTRYPAPEPRQASPRMVPFLSGPGHLTVDQLYLEDSIFAAGFEP